MSTEAEHTMVVLLIALLFVVWVATLTVFALIVRAAVFRIERRILDVASKAESHADTTADRIVAAVRAVPAVSVMGASRPAGWGSGAPN